MTAPKRNIEPVKGFQVHRFCDRVVAEKRLTKTALRVAFYLLARCDEKGTCFPGDDRIAKEIGHVGTSHVAAALKRLDDCGLVERVKRRRGGGFRLIAGSPLPDYQNSPLPDCSDQSTSGQIEVKAPSNGKKEEERVVVSATSTGGIPTFSDEAVDAVWEEAVEGTRSDPEPVSGPMPRSGHCRTTRSSQQTSAGGSTRTSSMRSRRRRATTIEPS